MAAWVDFGYQVPRSLYMAQTLFCSSCDYKIRPYITQWTDNEGRKWGRADLPDYCPRCKSKMDNGSSAVVKPKTCKNVAIEYDDCDQFVCSECGIELQDWRRVERDEDDGDVTYYEYRLRYCPNCGAKIGEN